MYDNVYCGIKIFILPLQKWTEQEKFTEWLCYEVVDLNCTNLPINWKWKEKMKNIRIVCVYF